MRKISSCSKKFSPLEVATRYAAVSLIVGLVFFKPALGQVKINSLFGDNMVLQQGMPVAVWGWAKDGEKITVEFAGQSVSTICAGGKWSVSLKALKASAQPRIMTIKGSNQIEIKNVVVGEVWLCSGQSNMERALHYDMAGDSAIAHSANPMLRFVTIPHNSKDVVQENVPCKWVTADPLSTKNFSATAYWFSSKLQKRLGIPVGIINSSYGGTTIESWLSRKVLDTVNVPHNQFVDSAAARNEYELRALKMKPVLDKYLAEKAEAAKQNLPLPAVPAGLVGEYRGPTVLYNGMIAPLVGYTIKGMVWYQGESNNGIGRANTYYALLPALIKAWRSDWKLGNLPFLIVQLTPFHQKTQDPNKPSGTAVICDAQRTGLKEPNTALIVTTDLANEDGDVHYKHKEPTGERLALAAEALAYGQKTEYSGPLYDYAEFKGSSAIIHFTHSGKGLVAKDTALTGFAIAGEDQKFYWGEAKIKGNQVIVTSPYVSQPKAVRYGWADNPTVNLFNREGLPAAVFRTDNWSLPDK